jgi:hypothetical protein
MSKRIGFVLAACGGVIATALAFNPHHARGADDCLAEPNRDPPEGRHWFYHVDRVNNRKCWYLGDVGLLAPRVVPEAANASGPSPPAPNASAAIAGRPTQREVLALSRARRDSLFQEFIRWNEIQRDFR